MMSLTIRVSMIVIIVHFIPSSIFAKESSQVEKKNVKTIGYKNLYSSNSNMINASLGYGHYYYYSEDYEYYKDFSNDRNNMYSTNRQKKVYTLIGKDDLTYFPSVTYTNLAKLFRVQLDYYKNNHVQLIDPGIYDNRLSISIPFLTTTNTNNYKITFEKLLIYKNFYFILGTGLKLEYGGGHAHDYIYSYNDSLTDIRGYYQKSYSDIKNYGPLINLGLIYLINRFSFELNLVTYSLLGRKQIENSILKSYTIQPELTSIERKSVQLGGNLKLKLGILFFEKLELLLALSYSKVYIKNTTNNVSVYYENQQNMIQDYIIFSNLDNKIYNQSERMVHVGASLYFSL